MNRNTEPLLISTSRRNYTAFDRLCGALGLWSPDFIIQEPIHATEAVLATILVNFEAVTGSHVTLQAIDRLYLLVGLGGYFTEPTVVYALRTSFLPRRI